MHVYAHRHKESVQDTCEKFPSKVVKPLPLPNGERVGFQGVALKVSRRICCHSVFLQEQQTQREDAAPPAIQKSSKGLILDCCSQGHKRVGFGHNHVSSWPPFRMVHFPWKCENRDAMPVRQEEVFKAVNKESRCLLDSSSSWEQRVFLITQEELCPGPVFQDWGIMSISEVTMRPEKWEGMMHHYTYTSSFNIETSRSEQITFFFLSTRPFYPKRLL